MNARRAAFLVSTVLVLACRCLSEEPPDTAVYRPGGITVQAGIGMSAVRDESISQEKYKGQVTWITAGWSRSHETYDFRLGLIYEKTPKLKNGNVSAELTGGGLEVLTLYPLGSSSIIGTNVAWYLGPAARVFFQYRKQHIARSADGSGDVYSSTLGLLELGARAEANAPLSREFQLEGALQSSILSAGGGTRNDVNEASFTLLTPLAALHASLDIAARYAPFDALSFALGYRLQLLRIDSWNFLLSASDNLSFSLTVQM